MTTEGATTSQVASGQVKMAIGIEDGRVLLRFEEPILYVLFDHQNAIDVAMTLTDRAFELRDGAKPAGATLKAELIERHRMTLTQRVALMLNTLREDKNRSNGQVAQAIVDACLRDIF